MDQVTFQDCPFSAAASNTSTFYCGNHDQIQIYISSITGTFASSPVVFTLQASYNSSISAKTFYYYDYVCQMPSECKVTAAAGGYYELPFGGGAPYLKISFDTAATQAGNIALVYPKITY